MRRVAGERSFITEVKKPVSPPKALHKRIGD